MVDYMKPTQAQIEAARKELKSRAYMWEIPDDMIAAAITAAAEAGWKEIEPCVYQRHSLTEDEMAKFDKHPDEFIKKAVFGEKQLDDEIIKALDEAENIESSTIERCAQVCDDGTESGEFYAAKIRALKDSK